MDIYDKASPMDNTKSPYF